MNTIRTWVLAAALCPLVGCVSAGTLPLHIQGCCQYFDGFRDFPMQTEERAAHLFSGNDPFKRLAALQQCFDESQNFGTPIGIAALSHPVSRGPRIAEEMVAIGTLFRERGLTEHATRALKTAIELTSFAYASRKARETIRRDASVELSTIARSKGLRLWASVWAFQAALSTRYVDSSMANRDESRFVDSTLALEQAQEDLKAERMRLEQERQIQLLRTTSLPQRGASIAAAIDMARNLQRSQLGIQAEERNLKNDIQATESAVTSDEESLDYSGLGRQQLLRLRDFGVSLKTLLKWSQSASPPGLLANSAPQNDQATIEDRFEALLSVVELTERAALVEQVSRQMQNSPELPH